MDFFNELQQSDWLNRNPEDYTYKKQGLSIGWEQTLLKDDAFSRFILKVNSSNLTTERKIMLTKQACTNILSRMNVLKNKARIVFTTDFQSWQRNGTVCVTLEPLNGKIKFPTFNHALDPILGYCVHEVAHFLYTDDDYDRYLNKFKGSEAKIKQTIMNVLEDERIEHIIAETFRGYTGYLGKAKDYCFGKKLEEEKKLNRVDDSEGINQLMQTFLYLLRYPKALDKNLVNKFEKPLRKVMDILTPYPSGIIEMTKCTDKIYDVFKDFYDEDDQAQQQDAQPQTDDSGEESSKDKGKPKKQDKTQEDNQEDNQEEDEQDNEQGGQGDEEDDQNGDNGDGGSKPSMEDALNDFLDAISSSEATVGDTQEVVTMLKGDYEVHEALEDISSFDNSQTSKRQSFGHTLPKTENLKTSELSVVFKDAKDLNTSTNHYDNSLAAVRTYAASLRAKIKQLNRNQIVTNRGLQEGDFDQGMLVDAIIGSKSVYKEEHKILNTGACIGLLIDESGSMSRGKWMEAQKIAVLFERALEGVNNVDFYCYGHTTGSMTGRSHGDSTWINVYYEGRKNSNRKILGKIYAHNTNRDGHAILETVGRMRSKINDPSMPIILFMISDGEPSASVPMGYSGVSYTKKAVDTVEKYSNTQIIHIAIEEGIPSASMFNTFVEFSDHATLVRDVGKLLKKIMIKQQKAVVL